MNKKKIVLSSLAAGVAVVALGAGGANAAGLIGSADIKDGSVKRVDLSAGVNKALNQAGAKGAQGEQGLPGTGAPGAKGEPGANGKDGKDGKDGFAGLYYVTAKYGTDAANNPSASVNGGAIATVACNDPADTAVSGGVQTLGLGGEPAAVALLLPGSHGLGHEHAEG